MNKINEKKNLIKNHITKEECEYICDDTVFDCASCSCLDECYLKTCTRSNEDFASSIGYGGYNTEEEFWEQI